MKKLLALFILAALAVGVSAQDFTIGGEVKTGLLMTKTEDQISAKGSKGNTTTTTAGNKDDAGSGSGRFRINLEYSVDGLYGIKARLQMEDWSDSDGNRAPDWPYAFGYVNMLDDQLTLSLGKLGASPWGTGGPELWKELESIDSLGGMRLEWKPGFIPEHIGKFNVGFVINAFDGITDMYPVEEPITFLHVLQETVLGISYTHDLFHARFAYRFDSAADASRDTPATGLEAGLGGGKIVYRVEEHAIEQVLPGFSIWALGYWYGVGAHEANKENYKVENWLFFQYAPDFLTAQIRVGYDVTANQQVVHVRPSVYGHLFDRLLTVGAMFHYGQDFGDFQMYEGSPYLYMVLEPLVQVNITPNSYVAAAYNWRREYVQETSDHIDRGLTPIKQTQWVNVRVGMTF
jgi:hypothetical protein